MSRQGFSSFVRRLLLLKVKPFEFFRYKVESEDAKEPDYLVDLLEYGGNGKCDCTNFRVEIGPVLEGTKKLTEEERSNWTSKCKHIIAGDLKLAAEVKREIIKHQIKCKNLTSYKVESKATAQDRPPPRSKPYPLDSRGLG